MKNKHTNFEVEKYSRKGDGFWAGIFLAIILGAFVVLLLEYGNFINLLLGY